MYGKKRVVITKRNEIVLAGGGNWAPVGYVDPHSGSRNCYAHVLNDEYDRNAGTVDIFARNKKALREAVNEKYKWL